MELDLTGVGLSNDETAVYAHLVREGAKPAGRIARSTGISRPLVYRALDSLSEKGLIEKNEEPNAVSLFSAKHPSTLETLADRRVKAAEEYKSALSMTVRSLTSEYNLLHGKPGVQFYEGEAGAREILDDTLTSTEIVYTYSDIDTVEGYVKEINDDYVHERIRKGIKKRILHIDSPLARARLHQAQDALTEIRIISENDAPAIHAAMQIYDNKVSYTTFTGKYITGTLIHDPAIYTLHRFLFDHLWNSAVAATK